MPSTATSTSVIGGDIIGATAPHGGMPLHAGSWQSVKPLLSLSMPSLQAWLPPAFSNGAGVRVAVIVGVCVGVPVSVGVEVGVRVGVAVPVCVGVAVTVAQVPAPGCPDAMHTALNTTTAGVPLAHMVLHWPFSGGPQVSATVSH